MTEQIEATIKYKVPVSQDEKGKNQYEKREVTIDVEVDSGTYVELEQEEKKEYLQRIAKKQFEATNKDAKDVHAKVYQKDIKELDCAIDDIYDTSDMTGEETYEEFMEHEEY